MSQSPEISAAADIEALEALEKAERAHLEMAQTIREHRERLEAALRDRGWTNLAGGVDLGTTRGLASRSSASASRSTSPAERSSGRPDKCGATGPGVFSDISNDCNGMQDITTMSGRRFRPTRGPDWRLWKIDFYSEVPERDNEAGVVEPKPTPFEHPYRLIRIAGSDLWLRASPKGQGGGQAK